MPLLILAIDKIRCFFITGTDPYKRTNTITNLDDKDTVRRDRRVVLSDVGDHNAPGTPQKQRGGGISNSNREGYKRREMTAHGSAGVGVPVQNSSGSRQTSSETPPETGSRRSLPQQEKSVSAVPGGKWRKKLQSRQSSEEYEDGDRFRENKVIYREKNITINLNCTKIKIPLK